MNSKLTLSIEEKIIDKAKQYAKKEGRSLSSIVEQYLKAISGPVEKSNYKKADMNPLVEELCGSVKYSKDKSYDDVIGKARIKKHLRR